MTTIEVLKSLKETNGNDTRNIEEALDEAIACVKQLTPVPPILMSGAFWRCPSCKRMLRHNKTKSVVWPKDQKAYKWCPGCGQAIDWSKIIV